MKKLPLVKRIVFALTPNNTISSPEVYHERKVKRTWLKQVGFINFANMNNATGKYIIIVGAVIIIIGIIVYFFHGKLNWMGKLPGDIRVEKENFKFYFPFTTMILLSLAITLIINVIRKMF